MINLQDYIIDSRLFKTLKADELLFVEYKCLIEKEVSDIWTHHNYLAFVTGGEKKWKTHKHEYLVAPGKAIFVKKGATTVYQYFEEPFFVFFLFLPDRFIREVLSRHPELDRANSSLEEEDGIIPLEVTPYLESFFNSLLTYFSQPEPPLSNLLKLKMEELILSIMSRPGNRGLKQYFTVLGQRRELHLKQLMLTHYTHPFSIEDFARLSARSLSSFRRDFRQIFGATPGRWLTRKRLEYSCLLLETSDKSIQEIVAESGFVNSSHFSRIFKATYGLSPSNFRALSGKKESV